MQRFESDRAYKMLLENILAGRITPGKSLSERALSEKFNIGRTPIREALRNLARDGVVEMVPARGTFVRRVTLKEIHNIFEIRCGLESMAAYLAAVRGPSIKLSEFKPIFLEMLKDFNKRDPNKISNLGEKFHREVIRSTDNDTLLNITHSLRLQYQIAFKLPRHYDKAWIKQSVDEHLKILEAIENRNGALSQKLMYEHLNGGLQVRIRIMRNFQNMQSQILFASDLEKLPGIGIN